jgi:hypothetical protein
MQPGTVKLEQIKEAANPFSPDTVRFFTAIKAEEDGSRVRLLIESLRRFGGGMKDCPIWIYGPESGTPEDFSGLRKAEFFPLHIEDEFRSYPLSEKVFAGARAEERAGADIHSLVWVSANCLIADPPVLFGLGSSVDAALRPVHLKNIGSLIKDPLDGYWQGIYRAVGIASAPFSVESFVDGRILRPYFNTHCFSVNPAKGILGAWSDHFRRLISDMGFQSEFCRDELHPIFLHQAILSALFVQRLGEKRIRNLPAAYGYPLHLQGQIPEARRMHILNRMACAVYEEPGDLQLVEVDEPMRAWWAAHKF